jgi:hypothetical protein
MSDLAIMFDEAYDAPTHLQTIQRLARTAKQFKTTYATIVDMYLDYTDSDAFYEERGL